MMIKEVPYEGRIRFGMESVWFGKAQKKDIPQLAAMYREIAVTKYNYYDKLKLESPHSFARQGGMFLLMDEGDIERELDNPHTFWAVFRNEEGKAIGSFWFSDGNELLPSWCIPGADAGQTAFPREVITLPEYRGRGLGRLLYATVFSAMLTAGYTHSICDVYKVVAYRAEGERKKELSLFNYPSCKTILGLGGRYLGEGGEKAITLPGLEVWIIPRIFEINHAYALLLCTSVLRQNGIRVEVAGSGKN